MTAGLFIVWYVGTEILSYSNRGQGAIEDEQYISQKTWSLG